MKFKEEWLFPNAVVPVDVETTQAMVEQIKRMMEIIGGMALEKRAEYERGFIDGMQKQMQSSVDRAVNAMAKREWVGLTDEEWLSLGCKSVEEVRIGVAIEAALRSKNNG